MVDKKNTPTTPADVSPIINPPNQKQTFGKSELLDAKTILRDILQIKPGNLVADLGAGGGLFTTQAAVLVTNKGQIYAVDIIKNILSEIASRARMAGLNNIKTVWSNLEMVGATKIKEASLDYCLLVNILFQSTKHFEVLSEATRLLKPGGKILIIDWSDTTPGFAPSNDRQVDPGEMIELSRRLNLTLEKEFRAGNYHFGLIFIKD